MASSKSYLGFILEQLSRLEGIAFRAMMGEYLLYCRGRLFGGIYDDRLMLKPLPAALEMLPDAVLEPPYEGAKPMIRVDDVENRELLAALVEAIYPELPEPRVKKKTKN